MAMFSPRRFFKVATSSETICICRMTMLEGLTRPGLVRLRVELLSCLEPGNLIIGPSEGRSQLEDLEI